MAWNCQLMIACSTSRASCWKRKKILKFSSRPSWASRSPRRRRWRKPPNAFQATFRGADVFDYAVPRSGVRYADELEWRFASRWSGIAWEDFQAMEGDDQSAVVAAYRCQMQ